TKPTKPTKAEPLRAAKVACAACISLRRQASSTKSRGLQPPGIRCIRLLLPFFYHEAHEAHEGRTVTRCEGRLRGLHQPA
ncbi:MAG: hypothetical protein WCG26_02785, partial [Chloroflexales bacterium]